MGKMLPYFPQEHYCDKPGVPVNKRANIIAGAAGMQAILFGMFGITPNIDGTLRIHPHPPQEGEACVSNFIFRGNTYDICLRPGHTDIHKNGELLYSGAPKEVVCL